MIGCQTRTDGRIMSQAAPLAPAHQQASDPAEDHVHTLSRGGELAPLGARHAAEHLDRVANREIASRLAAKFARSQERHRLRCRRRLRIPRGITRAQRIERGVAAQRVQRYRMQERGEVHDATGKRCALLRLRRRTHFLVEGQRHEHAVDPLGRRILHCGAL